MIRQSLRIADVKVDKPAKEPSTEGGLLCHNVIVNTRSHSCGHNQEIKP